MIANDVTEAVVTSDPTRITAMRAEIAAHPDPWQIHLSLFPAVQRVLNPPFINPHLPKMYGVCRDFVPYLSREGVASLVYLELVEYARRVKLEIIPRQPPLFRPVTFEEIEGSIAQNERDRAALLLDGFLRQQGPVELARRLLLLGSGYLEKSLRHSVSCTAFILLELLQRDATEVWPTLVLLADYFCKGGFHTTPGLMKYPPAPPLRDLLYRSVTGSGFVDIHHTITLYALERTRSFMSREEQNHLIGAWAAWMDTKQSYQKVYPQDGTIVDYDTFRQAFLQLDAEHLIALAGGMIERADDRSRLGAFLVTSVCDLYDGNYDPHYLTGLGALLWVLKNYHDEAGLAQNALYQYLDFYFSAMRSKR
ncbi:MAG: hypothetical protein ABIN58_10175 [candidate division WOR-3 bacterium]